MADDGRCVTFHSREKKQLQWEVLSGKNIYHIFWLLMSLFKLLSHFFCDEEAVVLFDSRCSSHDLQILRPKDH